MKKVYTDQNITLVANVKNIVEEAGLDCVLRNEFISGGMGELPYVDVWPELWVVEDSDYERACALIKDAFSERPGVEWVCRSCHERNDGSFEICWNCCEHRDK